ncbi:hypothetical protein GJA_992 [Janthinobacterium agaricidamnosum NBRC 102515 = DSM 9628]|uniref:Uncharacterized protein n=1 Tax=Janthinobacterium agaricidamnosum NBRC 102515 = DSM 9628 TaxID=1349767 RepID=W0V2Z8_9BURK|nr:hypothetical protein GJA_992 [Janthinobacterium agaricidamnosum NBRC 102515 = DSM 9628]
MALAEVASEIGKSPRAVERARTKLVKEGKPLHHGSRKGAYWAI